MSATQMTAEERLVASIALQPVDRVVCAPIIEQYAGQYAGISNREFMWDWEKCMAATHKVWEDFPVWDSNPILIHGRHAPVGQKCGPGQFKMPGTELAENEQYQMHEYEAMTRDDYAIVREKGFMEYRMTFLERIHNATREEVMAGMKQAAILRKDEIDRSLARGQSVTWGAIMGVLPFDAYSLMRSMTPFYKDIFQMGDQMEELLWAVNDAVIAGSEAVTKMVGNNRVFVGGVRGAGEFISIRQFKRFVWPMLKVMVEKMAEKDIVPVLHFDGNWTANLEFFLELPKAKFVLELDSATDIFKAHEILKGHCSIKGDVPPALFASGTADDVDAYARKLLGTFKNGEGLLYSSGCNLPMNAKLPNVKAFFDAVDKYGRYN